MLHAGPPTQGQSQHLEPEAFSHHQMTRIRNPEYRPYHQWLEGDAIEKMQLGASMRFGPAISSFLRAWLPHCKNLYSHPRAPNSELLHIFYDGSGWENFGATISQRTWWSAHSAPQNDVAVGWHKHLYKAMSIRMHYELTWAKAQGIQMQPFIIVLTIEAQITSFLETFLHEMFDPSEVHVCTIDSARGRTAPIVHFIKHRRTCAAPSWDQHHGLQSDLMREYMAYTRAQERLTVWMERPAPEEPQMRQVFGGQSRGNMQQTMELMQRRQEMLGVPHGSVIRLCQFEVRHFHGVVEPTFEHDFCRCFHYWPNNELSELADDAHEHAFWWCQREQSLAQPPFWENLGGGLGRRRQQLGSEDHRPLRIRGNHTAGVHLWRL